MDGFCNLEQPRALRATSPASWLNTRIGYVKLYGPNRALPANRWSGSNRGGWQDPRFDSLYDELNTTLDRAARNQAIVQAAKLVSEEVPLYPLYYNYDVLAHAATLRGPQPYAPGGEATWGVETWELSN